VAHLIRRGHRRIGFLSDLTSIRTAQDRYQGYLDALRAAGISPDPATQRRDLHTAAAAQAAATGLLRGPEPPTALFSAQNLVTMGAVRALRACGVQHRVALVGFDDFTLADLLEPGVTVVAQDVVAIGSLAAEILFARIDGDAAAPRARIVPTRLIERGSGEIEQAYQP
jgi:LacI family transcriptional regulator